MDAPKQCHLQRVHPGRQHLRLHTNKMQQHMMTPPMVFLLPWTPLTIYLQPFPHGKWREGRTELVLHNLRRKKTKEELSVVQSAS